MHSRTTIFLSLLFLSAALAVPASAQVPSTEKESAQPIVHELGRPLAVTLSVEPGDEANGVVVYTATRRFDLTIAGGAGHINLRLNGELTTKQNGKYLCEYRFTLDSSPQPDTPATHIETSGSVILQLGAATTIFKSKDLTATLTIKPAQ